MRKESGAIKVSWYRREGDLIHLITFGFHTYHDDHRFGLAFAQPEDWRLRIVKVCEADGGIYQCQVTTHPPRVLTTYLHVYQAVVEVVDERGVSVQEKFYREGSTIQLECRVQGVPAPAALRPTWRRDHHTLNYDDARGGVSVKTVVVGGEVRSWVRVGGALKQDSGIYSCAISSLASASVTIQVIPDERPAAIQGGGRACPWPSLTLLVSLSSSLLTTTTSTTCCTKHR
ncbi:hypothetical protein Pmani_024403 [Petrolisthes manimaculis]|uniref:Ig-like domain-containing protein n=1 Tax=Petrolisthes manimaculis TaxID=1843537 RepID=A0AAE1U2C1_9EUCA|nr:hypothetical protein Pmani_024403 [Petrolisthes manimaculis]